MKFGIIGLGRMGGQSCPSGHGEKSCRGGLQQNGWRDAGSRGQRPHDRRFGSGSCSQAETASHRLSLRPTRGPHESGMHGIKRSFSGRRHRCGRRQLPLEGIHTALSRIQTAWNSFSRLRNKRRHRRRPPRSLFHGRRRAVEYALAKEVWIPVIAESELALYRSRDQESVSAKAIALMRHGFGGHPMHKKKDPGT